LKCCHLISTPPNKQSASIYIVGFSLSYALSYLLLTPPNIEVDFTLIFTFAGTNIFTPPNTALAFIMPSSFILQAVKSNFTPPNTASSLAFLNSLSLKITFCSENVAQYSSVPSVFIFLISLLILGIVAFIFLYNFIFEHKNKTGLLLITLLIGFCLLGVGTGISTLEFASTTIIYTDNLEKLNDNYYFHHRNDNFIIMPYKYNINEALEIIEKMPKAKF